jgi:predicted RNase H-like HicB family nuclease
MEKEISCNVAILPEKKKRKTVYIARCEELGISDFGDTPEEAIQNLKTAISMLIEVEPSKKQALIKEKPIMTTRILL